MSKFLESKFLESIKQKFIKPSLTEKYRGLKETSHIKPSEMSFEDFKKATIENVTQLIGNALKHKKGELPRLETAMLGDVGSFTEAELRADLKAYESGECDADIKNLHDGWIKDSKVDEVKEALGIKSLDKDGNEQEDKKIDMEVKDDGAKTIGDEEEELNKTKKGEKISDEEDAAGKKEYIGSSADSSFYLIQKDEEGLEGGEVALADFVVVDEEDTKVLSAKELDVSTTDVKELIQQVADELKMNNISMDFVMKYDLFGVAKDTNLEGEGEFGEEDLAGDGIHAGAPGLPLGSDPGIPDEGEEGEFSAGSDLPDEDFKDEKGAEGDAENLPDEEELPDGEELPDEEEDEKKLPKESVLREQDEETFTVVARGISDKNIADKMSQERGGIVMTDDQSENNKKFMVVIKEGKVPKDLSGQKQEDIDKSLLEDESWLNKLKNKFLG